MIEDTLNLISNPEMNFKKPLKVILYLIIGKIRWRGWNRSRRSEERVFYASPQAII